MRIGLAAMMLALAMASTVEGQTQLQLQGQPYFGGSMSLHVSGTSGQPAVLAYGLNPLTTPLQTGKGPWYIGALVNILPIGSIPGGGRIDMQFTMPPTVPAFSGIPIVLQAYSPPQLSNPATLPLDLPYFEPAAAAVITAPVPKLDAWFGDRFETGDLNDDGSLDLVVGSWFEEVQGVYEAGRVYVLWGPTFQSSTALQSPNPGNIAGFGASVVVADVNQNGIDDLLVGEIVSDPPTPPDTGTVYLFLDSLLSVPSFAIQSPKVGIDAASFGRHVVVGDFNGDDWPDVADSMASASVAGQAKAGMIAVFWGPNFSAHAEIVSPTPGSSDFFGSDIAVGDVNGDGLDDLIEGSSRDDVGGFTNVGSVHAFRGPDFALLTTISNPVPESGSAFGSAVLGFDFNADGRDDIATSDERDNVYIYWAPDFQLHDELTKPPSPYVNPFGETAFGSYLATADVNEDGRDDLLISDPFEGGTGRLYLALGPHRATYHVIADALSATEGLFGRRAMLVDLDADGHMELLSADIAADEGGLSNSGHVTVFEPGTLGP